MNQGLSAAGVLTASAPDGDAVFCARMRGEHPHHCCRRPSGFMMYRCCVAGVASMGMRLSTYRASAARRSADTASRYISPKPRRRRIPGCARSPSESAWRQSVRGSASRAPRGRCRHRDRRDVRAAEPERHPRERRDRGRDRRSDRTDQNVAMQHMAELMRDNAFELLIVISCRMPAVKAIDECFGLRPVAKGVR